VAFQPTTTVQGRTQLALSEVEGPSGAPAVSRHQRHGDASPSVAPQNPRPKPELESNDSGNPAIPVS